MPASRRGTRRSLLIGLLLPVLAGGMPGVFAQNRTSSTMLLAGEDLVYNVSYGPFDLGQVRIRTYPPDRTGEVTVHPARADINSYPKVPLVDLHAVFESRMDSSIFSRWFASRMKDGDHWNTSRYIYDYAAKQVRVVVGRNDTIVARRDTLPLNGPMQDGLSLFFFARERLVTRQQYNVPVVVSEKIVNTYLNFIGERTSVDIDAVDYPVDVLRFDGTAQFTGIFGLTGDFEGWFSNDDARVPILAKMKVILGSVRIELMQWNRAGWAPPRGRN